MLTLFIFALIVVSVVYGIFFLIFKLLWLLFKSKRNLWPLVCAGVATASVFLLIGITGYQLYKQLAAPFQPIILAARQQTQPVIGQREYTDPRYGFHLTLYNATTLSHWIALDPVDQTHMLVGFDTNILLKDNTQDAAAFEGFLLLHQIVRQPQTDALPLAQALARQVQQAQSPRGEIRLLGEPVSIDVGPDASGAVVYGELISDQLPHKINLIGLVAVRENTCYYVIGFGGPTSAVSEMITSFRLPAIP